MLRPLCVTIFLFGYVCVCARNSYDIWCVGKCDHDKVTSSQPGAVLMGGGQDTTEAFEWQINNANGGDFVILRASGDDAYNEWVFEISLLMDKPLNSVTTILFKKNSAVTESEVLTRIKNAEAIFFAGGDQSSYLSMWVGTEVQSIIQSKLGEVTVGGTSAGLAILGNWVYSGEYGSAESEDAMLDPYERAISLEPAFLRIPFMDTIVTDTHFVTRDRMGRMLTFVARIVQDSIWSSSTIARGVGVDEHTALLLNVTTGDVLTVGVNTAYVCTPTHMVPEVCEKRTPLTYTSIHCVRLSASSGDTFSFNTFTAPTPAPHAVYSTSNSSTSIRSGKWWSGGSGGVSFVNSVVEGSINPKHYGPAPTTTA